MSKKIYVGNLPYTATEADLQKLFESFGELGEVVIIKDKFSGRSKGFGFVTINDDEAAAKAISELNGKDVNGRALTVNEAKPMDPDRKPMRRSFDGGRGGGFGGGGGGFGGNRGGSGGRGGGGFGGGGRRERY
ncbi:MAG: RNA-binding protein [Nanoarchaeota archaeon]|nr:RNA-binding protein [Nanoarchaeota archaeon]